jgi:hypothetical protein
MAADQGDTVEAGELAVAANCSVSYGTNCSVCSCWKGKHDIAASGCFFAKRTQREDSLSNLFSLQDLFVNY